MEWDGETGLYVLKEFNPAKEQLEKNPRNRTAYVDPRTGRSTSRYCENPVRADRCNRGNAYSFAGDNPWSAGESCNVIKGCWIGLDAGGRSDVGNGNAGVFISRGTASSKMSVLFNPKEYSIQKSAAFGRRHELTGHVTLMK